MKNEQRDAIDEIMDNFDFNIVRRTMAALGWTWVTSEEIIPTESELRTTARGLLKDAIECESTAETGGFRASYNPTDGDLNLEFIVSAHYTTIE